MSRVLDTFVSACAVVTLVWLAYIAYRHDQREQRRQEWLTNERHQLRAHQFGGQSE